MTSKAENEQQTPPAEHRPIDEHANLITHGLGFLLSVMGAILLMSRVWQIGSGVQIAATSTYCVSLVALYAASTLSHLFHDLAWRRFFRTLDQACIYLLIAGSFTPFSVVYLWHAWWPLLLVVMWLLAGLGVLLVLHMRNLTPGARLTYGILGWLPVISLKTIYDAAPMDMFAWIVAGGLFYSSGAIFLKFDLHVRYFHAMWHTFVIAGSVCHYIAIMMLLS